jgi:hypothetical protein
LENNLTPEVRDFFYTLNITECGKFLLSHSIKAKDADSIARLINYIDDEQIQEVANIAQENKSLVLLGKLVKLGKKFNVDPNWIISMSSDNIELVQKYYELTKDEEIITKLKEKFDEDISAAVVIAHLEPDTACMLASTKSNKDNEQILKVLTGKNLTVKSSIYIRSIINKRISPITEEFLSSSLGVCDPNDFKDIKIRKITDIRRAALVIKYLPDAIPLIKDAVIEGMNKDFVIGADEEYFKYQSIIYSKLGIHNPNIDFSLLGLKPAKSQADDLFNQFNGELFEKSFQQVNQFSGLNQAQAFNFDQLVPNQNPQNSIFEPQFSFDNDNFDSLVLHKHVANQLDNQKNKDISDQEPTSRNKKPPPPLKGGELVPKMNFDAVEIDEDSVPECFSPHPNPPPS